MVTGGHAVADTTDVVVDVVAVRDTDTVTALSSPRLATANTHGSGCTFASAVAARLARGEAAADAVRGAHAWVHAALASSASWRLGAGHGPLDHRVPVSG